MTLDQALVVALSMAAAGCICYWGLTFGRFTKEIWPKRYRKRKRTPLPSHPH